jgi:PAS domain S-box-containing protein
MSLTDPARDPVGDGVGKSAEGIDDRRDRLGKNLLSLGDAVIVTDAHGNVILLNPVAESLTGWTDHDARDRPIEAVFRIIHEVTRQPAIQPVMEVIARGGIQDLAPFTLLIAKDGSERPVADSASPMRGEGGDLDGVILIFKDTSERRRQERQLEDDRRHGEVIIAAVHDSLVVLDVAHRVRSANRSFYEVFQTSPQETIGRSLFDLGDGQWNIDALRALLEEILTQAKSSGEFQVERDFPSIGKRVMLINARQLNGKDGREMMILLAIEDITGRSRMADSLAASEVRFRRLFEAAQDGILILDAENGAIEDANPFLLELLGYSRAEILGKHLWEIGLFGDIEASRASFRELQEKGYVRYEDLPLETKDGRHVEVEFVSNVYRVGDHMIIQCNIRDVTARKRVDEELRQAKEAAEEAKEAAEEAGRAKDRFLATLSHELRTPLTPVLATISYVEMRPDLPAGLRQDLDSIRRNVELEARLIDDLLDVTRIGQGKLELHREVLDIHAALRAALEVCQGEVETKKLKVSLELWAEVHHVWADPARMQQVFWNLIKNAVKFTPAAGRLSFRSADVGAGRMAIEVADTGMGIEPEALSRIFDAFEQGDRSVTRRHGGLGLGLAIAKMLVDLHAGALTVTSGGRSGGSVFRVELETVATPEDRDQPPAPAAGAAGLYNVLLVDDNAETLRTIANMLRSSGLDVRTATSVESALAVLGGERFDLLVSDIGLPDGSGLDIMRHGRDHLGLRGIAFSGYATDQDVRASKEAGFAHHLAKPSGLGRLVGLIKRMAS